MTELTCFKAYDIRGEIDVNIDEYICYRIGRAVAQHIRAKSVVIGFDARETSPVFAAAAARGVMDAGADVINIGMAGTEEMYWAVTEFSACAGIEVTASHNPINYNGMKIVKSQSRPLDDKGDFRVIKALAASQEWASVGGVGKEFSRSAEARETYVDRVLSFVSVKALRPLKVVVNSGNGAAGPTFDAISKRLSSLDSPLEFIHLNGKPDSNFPNGIPNPILVENQEQTANVVRETKADFGIAFDGDFDRCFFFDEKGEFIRGEYMVGLLASCFLDEEGGASIVHDCRVIMNIRDIAEKKGGVSVLSKTGHAFVKQTMRENKAIYGGEISAHHYFRDFAYCDSGMIPWLKVAEIVSRSNHSLGDLVAKRVNLFPSSGEINFQVDNPKNLIENILEEYQSKCTLIDKTDGISLSFDDWRFNLRTSNTEPLMRLNIETDGNNVSLGNKINEIAFLLGIKKA